MKPPQDTSRSVNPPQDTSRSVKFSSEETKNWMYWEVEQLARFLTQNGTPKNVVLEVYLCK